ncbi:MAG: RluA family pseudouridine synthase [Bacteriovoracaceae bacterium]|nr:RluA family pseudouridine synthase [Bacteriovoracaceae bacterium]
MIPQDDGTESESQIVIVTEEDTLAFKRLDVYLTDKIENLSRNFIKSLFIKNLITLTEESPYQGKLELKKLPPVGTEIYVDVPPPLPSDALAQDIPLEILFEDEHLVIVNKEAGMVVHPAPGHYEGTLVNAILHHCKDLTGVGDQMRPGIVHRLDKGTSGIMVVAKNQKCHEGLVLLFSDHDIEREYQALVMKTKMAAGGPIETTIGRHPQNRLKMKADVRNGKRAKTFYRLIESFPTCSLVKCTLETGRTHQIRVHMSEVLKAPIVMDPLYGSPIDHLKRLPPQVSKILKNYPHPLLHARKLGFVHPITKEKLVFETEPPEVFSQVLDFLRKEDV